LVNSNHHSSPGIEGQIATDLLPDRHNSLANANSFERRNRWMGLIKKSYRPNKYDTRASYGTLQGPVNYCNKKRQCTGTDRDFIRS
jgi:hypothetical protein